MKQFMDKDFLLSSESAQALFHNLRREYADSRLPLPHQPERDR